MAHHSQTDKASKPPCCYYLSGHCTRSEDQCEYRHEEEWNAGCSRGFRCSDPEHKVEGFDDRTPCCFFLRGRCQKTDEECAFQHTIMMNAGCSNGHKCTNPEHKERGKGGGRHDGGGEGEEVDTEKPDENTPCCFFLRGGCTKSAEECLFRHSTELHSGCSRGFRCAIPDHRKDSPQSRPPCCFFLGGECSKSAQECAFPHERIYGKGCSRGARCANPNHRSRVDAGKPPCCFFLNGRCTKGNSCSFLHQRVFMQVGF